MTDVDAPPLPALPAEAEPEIATAALAPPVLTGGEHVHDVRDTGVVVLEGHDGSRRLVRIPLERVPALRELLARLVDLESRD